MGSIGKKWFNDRLKGLGYKSYREYLFSEHWQKVKARYKKSKRPQYCLCCNDPRYQLHHHTYERLGKERLTDLTPLCKECHRKLHKFLRRHPEVKLSQTKLILERIRPSPK